MVGGAYAPRHRWCRSILVARLPSHSQGYCNTHEARYRSGFCRSIPRVHPANFRTRPESQEGGLSGFQSFPGPPRASQGPLRNFSASQKRFRSLQAFSEAPRASHQKVARPPRPLSASQNLQRTQMKRCCC